MNIVSALMNVDMIRLSYGNRWLIFDEGEWVVYEHKYHAKNSQVLIRTQNQDEAIDVLIKD